MALQLTWSCFTSIALILSGIVLINGEDNSISLVITPRNETIYPGTEVTVTCRILMNTNITEHAIVRMKKVVITDDRTNIPVESISTLTALEGPYKNLGRFALSRTTDKSDLVYTLTISGVKAEDSGTYTCSADSPNLYAVAMLQVYRPPAGISFPGFNDSIVVELTEGEVPHKLECLVSYVMPVPDVSLKVDGRDITSESLVSTLVNTMCTNIVAGKTCPLHQNYNVTAVTREYRPVYTDDGKDLVCTSQMREFNRTVNSTSVHLSVRYAPKISCAPVRVIVNSSNVALRCIVYANPFMPYNRTWFVTIDGKNITLKNNADAKGEFEVLPERMDRSANPKKAEVTLNILRASSKYFSYKYYLQVENEIGQTEFPIKFEQLTAATPNDSPTINASNWTTLTLMTSSFLLYFGRLF